MVNLVDSWHRLEESARGGCHCASPDRQASGLHAAWVQLPAECTGRCACYACSPQRREKAEEGSGGKWKAVQSRQPTFLRSWLLSPDTAAICLKPSNTCRAAQVEGSVLEHQGCRGRWGGRPLGMNLSCSIPASSPSCPTKPKQQPHPSLTERMVSGGSGKSVFCAPRELQATSPRSPVSSYAFLMLASVLPVAAASACAI